MLQAVQLFFKFWKFKKRLLTNTSEEFIKCRLDNFTMSIEFYTILRKFQYFENK